MVEFVLHALGAERALKGADPGLETVVKKFPVATLAVWA